MRMFKDEDTEVNHHGSTSAKPLTRPEGFLRQRQDLEVTHILDRQMK